MASIAQEVNSATEALLQVALATQSVEGVQPASGTSLSSSMKDAIHAVEILRRKICDALDARGRRADGLKHALLPCLMSR